MSSSRKTLARVQLSALALVATGAVGGYWFARHEERSMPQMHGARTSITAAGAPSDKPLYWYDPMQPNQHFDKPGKSPFMDMQLVPKYAEAAIEAGGIRIDPNAVQNLGIRTGRVERTASSSKLRVIGTVAFDEHLLDLVQARVEGSIIQLYVKAPLDRVRRGQPLAEVLVPQWLEAEQQYVALLGAESDSATSNAARERMLVLGIPESAIQELERSRKAPATTTIYSPRDGVVTDLPVRQGASYMAGASLFRINGLKSVWVNAQIPEARVAAAGVGSTVEVHATAWPADTFTGRMTALLPDVDRETRTLTARVSIDNFNDRLSPGMYVTLEFSHSTGEPQLSVPTEAVIVTGTRSVVIVKRPDGSFDVANVKLGPEADGRTVILSGLEEGEQIVLSGQFLIDSEASLSAAVSRLKSAPADMKP